MSVISTLKVMALAMAYVKCVTGTEIQSNATIEPNYPTDMPYPPFPTDPATAAEDPVTVFTTIIFTISSCASTITDCPYGSTTTMISSMYTLPMTTTASDSNLTAATASETANSNTDGPWSTIYTTRTYTISSCHPTVTNCPYGSKTTDVISVTTTYCPITMTPLVNTSPIMPPAISPPSNNTQGPPTMTPATEPPPVLVQTITNLHTMTRTISGEGSATGTGVIHGNGSTNSTFVQTSGAIGGSFGFLATLSTVMLVSCLFFF